MLARFVAWAGLIGWLTPALAGAQPLNVADPTPRTIRVQFEISDNPLLVGQTYSEPVDAQYSVTGNIGMVVIPHATYEAAIQTQDLDYFGLLTTWSLIGGSASDFALDIDLTTLEAVVVPHTYQVSITSPVQQVGTVSRVLFSTNTAGFGYFPGYGTFPFFTTTPCGTCALVPGAPYDPITGKVNAVGRDRLVAPDITLNSFSRVGDLRLSEIPTPGVPALSGYALGGLVVVLTGLALAMLRRGR